MKGNRVLFFSAFNIDKYEYFNHSEFMDILSKLGLESVPVLDLNFKIPDTMDKLIECSNGKSVLNKNTRREGVVMKSFDGSISFKVISNEFLLKEK